MATVTEATCKLTKDAQFATKLQKEEHRRPNVWSRSMKWEWIPKSHYVVDTFEESQDSEDNIRKIVSARYSGPAESDKIEDLKLHDTQKNVKQSPQIQLSENNSSSQTKHTKIVVDRRQGVNTAAHPEKWKGPSKRAVGLIGGSVRDQSTVHSGQGASDRDQITVQEQEPRNEVRKKCTSPEAHSSVTGSHGIQTNSARSQIGNDKKLSSPSVNKFSNNNASHDLHTHQSTSSMKTQVESKYVDACASRPLFQFQFHTGSCPSKQLKLTAILYPPGSNIDANEHQENSGTSVQLGMKNDVNKTGNSMHSGATSHRHATKTNYISNSNEKEEELNNTNDNQYQKNAPSDVEKELSPLGKRGASEKLAADVEMDPIISSRFAGRGIKETKPDHFSDQSMFGQERNQTKARKPYQYKLPPYEQLIPNNSSQEGPRQPNPKYGHGEVIVPEVPLPDTQSKQSYGKHMPEEKNKMAEDEDLKFAQKLQEEEDAAFYKQKQQNKKNRNNYEAGGYSDPAGAYSNTQV